MEIYDFLFEKYGEQRWWPVHSSLGEGDRRFEIIIGCILTQNTSWKNVEKVVDNLYERGLISAKKILEVDVDVLKDLIRSAGYYNQKAERLKRLARFYLNFSNSVPTREDLLELNGVGEETADSILLYAYDLPYFVVDTYTKRFIGCLLEGEGKNFKGHSYGEWQDFFHSAFFKLDEEKKVKLFKEFHALIVQYCKDVCVKGRKFCEDCNI